MRRYNVSAEVTVQAPSKDEAEEQVRAALRMYLNSTPIEHSVGIVDWYFGPTLMLREAPR